MAGRIRSIKPEILDTKRTAALSHEAWRLFVSMITLADDYGNLIAEPRRLEGAVFWASPTVTPIEDLVIELVAANLIDVYESRGCLFAHLTGWAEHQRVDKPGPSKADKPEEGQLVTDIREWLANGSRMAREAPGKIRPGLDRKGLEGSGSISPADAGGEFDFEAVYAKYPRKEGRKKGQQRFKSQITSRSKYDALIRAVENYAATITDTAYAKHFDTFMGCWEDYVDAGLLTPRTSAPRGNIAPAAHVERGYDATKEFGT